MKKRQVIKKLNEQSHKFHQKDLGIKRSEYDKCVASLQVHNVTLITGLRRVGKTTLMRQMHEYLLKSGTSQSNITYFSFDEHITRSLEFLTSLLETIISINSTEQLYVFLDEVQYIENWQGTIKKYVDLYPNVKLIISGSSSLFIKNKSNESLAGRVYEVYISPLSFTEYLSLFNQKVFSHYNLKSFLLHPKFKTFQEIQNYWFSNDEVLISNFDNYQAHGHFPETQIYDLIEDKYNYISNGIFTKLIEEDLPPLYNIKNIPEFNRLFRVLVSETGNYLEIGNLANELSISKNTLKRYLEILKDGFLVNTIHSFHKSLRKQTRAKEKHFVASANFYAAFKRLIVEVSLPQLQGHMFETTVYWKLKRCFPYLFFWYRNKNEIDILASEDPMLKEMLPIEIKYKTKVQKEDLRILKNYMESKNIKNGFVLSLSADHITWADYNIWIVPGPLFL